MLYLELNLYGNVAANVATDNYTIRNDIPTTEGQVIVPENGLFLELNHEVIHTATGDVLVAGLDYYLTYKSLHLESVYGVIGYGGIVITNKALTGSVDLTVHHVGGGYSTYNTTLISETLLLTDGVPIDVSWGDITETPTSVRPTVHGLSAENIKTGFTEMVSMLYRLSVSLDEAADKWDKTKVPIGTIIKTLNPSNTLNLTYWVPMEGQIINRVDYVQLFLIMDLAGETYTLPNEPNSYIRTN